MPLVSVVVPIYKVEPYLKRCIDSILNQTFTDFDLILVDDGSPDNCGKICDEYAKIDDRIIVIHQENGGLSAARNAGIHWSFLNSDSEWITFIDSDDYVSKYYLEVLYNSAIDNNVLCSVCGFSYSNDSSVFDVNIDNYLQEVYEPDIAYEKFIDFDRGISLISTCMRLYSKSLFDNIRYPVNFICEDKFINYLLLFSLKSVVVNFLPLYYYYQSNDSIMRSEWSSKRFDDAIALEKQINYFKTNGFDNAFRATLNYLMRLTCNEISEIKKSKQKYKLYLKFYRLQLRYLLKKYSKIYPEFSLVKNGTAYFAAYPHLKPFLRLVRILIIIIKKVVDILIKQ